VNYHNRKYHYYTNRQWQYYESELNQTCSNENNLIEDLNQNSTGWVQERVEGIILITSRMLRGSYFLGVSQQILEMFIERVIKPELSNRPKFSIQKTYIDPGPSSSNNVMNLFKQKRKKLFYIV